MIARALIHEPKLLILDEPTAGVDVELRRSMWEFLIEINKQGTTIVLTTHYLEESENLCRNIAIIDQVNIIEDKKAKLVFTLEGEGNTLCAALENELWNDKKVKIAGYHIDHPLTGIPRFVVETDGADPKKTVQEAIKRVKQQIYNKKKARSKKIGFTHRRPGLL